MSAQNNPLSEVINQLKAEKKDHPFLYRWLLPNRFITAFEAYLSHHNYETEYNFLNAYKHSLWFFHRWIFNSLRQLHQLPFMQRFLNANTLHLKDYQIIHEHNDPDDTFLAIGAINHRCHKPEPTSGKILSEYPLSMSWASAYLTPQLRHSPKPSQFIFACIKLIDAGFIGPGKCRYTDLDGDWHEEDNFETNKFSPFLIHLLSKSDNPDKLAQKFLDVTHFNGYEHIARPSPINAVSAYYFDRYKTQFNMRTEMHSRNPHLVIISNEDFAKALYQVIAEVQDERKAQFIFDYFSAHCCMQEAPKKLQRITRISDQIGLINLFKLSENYGALYSKVESIIANPNHGDTLKALLNEPSLTESVSPTSAARGTWTKAKAVPSNISPNYFKREKNRHAAEPSHPTVGSEEKLRQP